MAATIQPFGPVTIVLVAAGLSLTLSTLLAALLMLAERYLANYGRCQIDVNEGARRFDAPGGGMLLNTLKDQGIFLASACGGKGTCAYCKCKILSGGGPVGPTESPLLSEAEVAESVRISCQVKVRNDLKIVVPEALLAVQAFRGQIGRITDLTHDIKELRIDLQVPAEIKFTAGQYVQLDAPLCGTAQETVFRAYSISSQPEDSQAVELIIRLVPGGLCTTWVFTVLKEGEEVTFTGPYGDFRLSDSDREMVWIAGGSGMAPFWSMIRHMKKLGIQRKCTYFFGAAQKRDLFFVDELRKLADELPWFTFIPALSAPAESDQWTGETGLITEVVDRHISDGSQLEGYLCGSSGMIDASIKVLRAKGIPNERIYYDKFT